MEFSDSFSSLQMSFDLKVFQKFILNNLDRQAKYDIFTSKCIDKWTNNIQKNLTYEI